MVRSFYVALFVLILASEAFIPVAFRQPLGSLFLPHEAAQEGDVEGVEKVRGNKSRFVGVSWNRKYMKWQAEIKYNGKHSFLGRYQSEEAAAMAYDARAADFQRPVNFPMDGQKQAKKRGLCNIVSKYSGVTWHQQAKKWQARVSINGKLQHLGLFENERDAAVECDNHAASPGLSVNFPKLNGISQARKRGTSKYVGVHLVEGRWHAVSIIHGQPVDVGFFESEEEAAQAIDDFLVTTHGAKRVNFPEEFEREIRQALPEPQSEYIGVKRQLQSRKFEAYISISGKSTLLGIYEHAEAAAMAYDARAALLARPVNFPRGGQKQARKRGSSKFRGVSWLEREQKWVARATVKGKSKVIGRFKNEQDAARAYDNYVLSSNASSIMNFPSGFNWRGIFHTEAAELVPDDDDPNEGKEGPEATNPR